MRRLIAALLDRVGTRVPQRFRVLHRQFLLRVIDLEALSIEADIPRFLGQFCGVLIMLSFLHSFAVYVQIAVYPWRLEHYLISTMMLVAGLITVVSWDSIFPDRRDIMVLAPLPVPPRVILGAKVCASASLLGIALLSLNVMPGLIAPLILGQLHASTFGFFQVLAAYWVAMIAAVLFLFCAVLAVQGLGALLLPRKVFLMVSAVLQLGTFGLFISVYFLEPALGTIPELTAPQNAATLKALPEFWFLGLLNQMNGTLPPELTWLAERAWIALGIAVAGATLSLLMCYLRTMKATVEAPDLVSGAGGLHWNSRYGGLRTAVAAFSFRSLVRSRQHRVILAFFLAIVFAIGLTCLRREILTPAPEPVPADFLISTLMMTSLTVLGLRATFALPVSLNANWMLRLTQLRPTAKYIAATRSTLLLFAVAPMLVITALLGLNYRPWQAVGVHIGVLALFGALFVELALIKFDKVPFTCSYLPGKADVQVIFWGVVVVWIILAVTVGTYEYKALADTSKCFTLAGTLAALIAAVSAYNRIHARTAVLYFEEVPVEAITRLGLVFVPPAKSAIVPPSPVGK
ncbi:MAG TPA: hypothetical protein VGJ21_14675 [Terracidiphilus sp.]|jgi:hypothetical protein